MPNNAKPRRRFILKLLAVVIVAIIGWIVYDLYAPRTAQLRNFNADEVARLETAMWRSYYDKQRLRLFNQLAELLRTQYNMPFVRSNVTAYHGARAAFVFKDGRQRSDYEKALPNLVSYYELIRKMSDLPFDVNRAAQLELEWWIIHRQRAQHAPGDLDRALAELQAEIYRVPLERLAEHGRLRAEAMAIRDNKAEAGGVSEEDWAKIEELLLQSWRSLYQVVNTQSP
jgi:hypothetical protein